MHFKFKILIQSTAMVMISLMLIVILCYFSAKSFLLNNQISMLGETFKQCCQMTDSFKVLIENIINSSITRPDFAAIVDNKNYQSKVLDELESVRAMNLNIAGIHLYTYNGISYNSDRFLSYYTLNDYLKIDQYDEFLKSDEVSAWLYNDVAKDKLAFTCKIFRDGTEIGFVQADVRLDVFLEFFDVKNQKDSSAILYYVKENMLLSTSNMPEYDDLKKKILEMIVFEEENSLTNDKDGVLFYKKFIHDSLYLVKYESLAPFYQHMNRLKIIFTAISILLLLGINIMYYQLIGKMVESLRSLGRQIRKYHH